MWQQQKIYLASNSPRRKQILQQLGFEVYCVAVEIDEAAHPQEKAQDYVLRMAKEKNQAALINFPNLSDAPLLSADTSVVLDECILGKPCNATEAADMLRALSDKKHLVQTAVCISYQGKQEFFCQSSIVHFAHLTQEEIAQYIATGEPLDKAGAYGIQGLGGIFVRHLSGSYSGVMGLPIYETSCALKNILSD